jgi:hypothetical protein
MKSTVPVKQSLREAMGLGFTGDGTVKVQLVFGSLIIILLAGVLFPGLEGLSVSAEAPTLSALAGELDIAGHQSDAADAAARRKAEEQILRSTVRIYIETWTVKPDDSGYDVGATVSHATLKDGRFLVTHNHFSAPLADQSAGTDPIYAVVTLANSDGQALFRGPLSDFVLIWKDPQTLVIRHKDDGLFEKLGFVSAEFEDWSAVPLKPGLEVAQVDWDGETTRVDWTTIQEVDVDDGVPRLVLADGVTLGASGGGVFWQGKHIANNWLLVQELGSSGEFLDTATKVALDSAQVANGPGQVVASR